MAIMATMNKLSVGRPSILTFRRMEIIFPILMFKPLPERRAQEEILTSGYLKRILLLWSLKVRSLLRSISNSRLAKRLSSKTARLLYLVVLGLSLILLADYLVSPLESNDTSGSGQVDLTQERRLSSNLWLQAIPAIGTLTENLFSRSTQEHNSFFLTSIRLPISRRLNSIRCAMGLGCIQVKEVPRCSWWNLWC